MKKLINDRDEVVDKLINDYLKAHSYLTKGSEAASISVN